MDVVIGHLKDKVALNLRLSAMEDSGNGRIISQPRIMTLDNTQATISSGETIQLPTYRALSSTTIVTGEGKSGEGGTEKEAKTALIVTPHIISDNQIKLKICINRDTPDYSRQVNDVPVINTRQADTELIVAHGETAVIGGLATSGVTDKSERVPWLSRIPVLGWLFKSKAKISEYGELLVFITPHIIEAPDYAQKTEQRQP
jgi:type IV pilus assembly protein PilQ